MRVLAGVRRKAKLGATATTTFDLHQSRRSNRAAAGAACDVT
jgi:hypothetical protein